MQGKWDHYAYFMYEIGVYYYETRGGQIVDGIRERNQGCGRGSVNIYGGGGGAPAIAILMFLHGKILFAIAGGRRSRSQSKVIF